MTPPPDATHDPDSAAAGAHEIPVSRPLRIAAAQMGPIARHESRVSVVNRMLLLLEEAGRNKVELVVYPELTLTTFFPRWYVEGEDDLKLDSFYETEMPGPDTQPLFDRAKE
ncbi:MAG: hypothetical protein GWP47_07790, partial [Actinobacteria bacterium]|nr:hypothetical protein [Actinomycetota bacterium]